MPYPSLPPQMKSIQKFMQTSVKLQSRNPVAAYYCRFYAVQTAVKEFGRDPQLRAIVINMLDAAEADKKDLLQHDEIKDIEKGKLAMWKISMQYFAKADDIDRSGSNPKNALYLFQLASILFETLLQFQSGMDDTTQERYKYAKYKAVYIARCLREGVTPVAGPVDADGNAIPDTDNADPSRFPSADEMETFENELSSEMNLPPAAAAANTGAPYANSSGSYPSYDDNTSFPPPQAQPYSPPATQPSSTHAYPPAQPQPSHPPSHLPSHPPASQSSGYPPANQTYHHPVSSSQSSHTPQPSHNTPNAAAAATATKIPMNLGALRVKNNIPMKDQELASKNCKFAISCLSYDDAQGAVEYLQKALQLLTE